MKIQSSSVNSHKRFQKPVPAPQQEVPGWVDSFVPNPHTTLKSAAAVTTGLGLGIALGVATDQVLLGGALGLGAGLTGTLVVHALAKRQKSQIEQSVLKRHDEQRSRLQANLGVPEQPSTVFKQAKVYENEKNILVEFPANGGFLSVTNSGPKRPVMWISENEARGPAGETAGRVNLGIEPTEMKISLPLRKGVPIYGSDDIQRYNPLSERDLQVQLDKEGHLNIAHSGKPDGGVTYDLETGKVESPYLTIDNGLIEKFRAPYPNYYGTGYSYKNGKIREAGKEGRTFSMTLPPEWLGQTVRFPSIEGANGRRVDVPVDIKNDGIFERVTVARTMETKSIPAGSEWVEDPKDRLLREDIQATLQGGISVTSLAGEVRINGEKRYLKASASEDTLVLSQHRSPNPYTFTKFSSQEIHKDGTVVWRENYAPEKWTSYTFKPDGSVSGVNGSVSYAGNVIERPMGEEYLPKILEDGRIERYGAEMPMFISLQELKR